MVATNDNMHDPRRPEVPEPEYDQLVNWGDLVRNRVRDGDWRLKDIVNLLDTIYREGAVAGMRAQYEHDQEAGK